MFHPVYSRCVFASLSFMEKAAKSLRTYILQILVCCFLLLRRLVWSFAHKLKKTLSSQNYSRIFLTLLRINTLFTLYRRCWMEVSSNFKLYIQLGVCLLIQTANLGDLFVQHLSSSWQLVYPVSGDMLLLSSVTCSDLLVCRLLMLHSDVSTYIYNFGRLAYTN